MKKGTKCSNCSGLGVVEVVGTEKPIVDMQVDDPDRALVWPSRTCPACNGAGTASPPPDKPPGPKPPPNGTKPKKPKR